MRKNLRKAFFFLIFALIFGCASIEKISERILYQDTYSRTYDINFYSFHPKINSSLQEYARKNKGNSFQISRLGSEEVIWRGVFKMKNTLESFQVEIFSKPSGPKKSKLVIKFLGDYSPKNAASWERASAEFFQVIEESAKISPSKD